MTLTLMDSNQQWDNLLAVQNDPRPRISTGFSRLDGLLYRGGFSPGTFCLLAGRLHTRKTSVAVNLMANMLADGVPVLFASLDEAPHMYVAKLASCILRVSHIDDAAVQAGELQYKQATSLFTMVNAHRPGLDDLTQFLDDAVVYTGERPRVVFIDYLSLLQRGKYDGKDQTRIPRLAEDLQAWTNQQGVVTIALHQVGRQGDSDRRVHGDEPITPEQLMYGGEQQADIIFGTYRPSLNPIGNMSQEMAEAAGIELPKWQEYVNRVVRYSNITFLQLIKNRPGIYLNPEGIQLESIGDTQLMKEVP